MMCRLGRYKYILLGFMLLWVFQTHSTDSEEIPIWSKGLSYTCCDIYPSSIMSHGRSFFEKGLPNDDGYIYRKRINNYDIVYVVTSDLPDFIIKVFSKLNESIRIILVTGCEDIGTPYEIFHPNRPNFFDYKMSALWPHGHQDISLESFLNDNRLLVWFAQNYDAIGCNIYTCSTLNNITHFNLLKKLIPIPIGIDLHSFGLQPSNINKDQLKLNTENKQYQTFQLMKSLMLSYKNRIAKSLVVSFECSFDHTKIGQARYRSRGPVCTVIPSLKGNSISLVEGLNIIADFKPLLIENRKIQLSKTTLKHMTSNLTPAQLNLLTDIINAISSKSSNEWNEKELKRLEFWMSLSFSKFALAPPGFGMDTHRFWEILQFECIPIVLTSPLDSLYEEYPVIILQSWDELKQSDSMERFENYIKNKFGENPFSEDIRQKLSLRYWSDRIRNMKKVLQGV